MGEIAEMMLEGLLDIETGEYIGDFNKAKYSTESPGFPVSLNDPDDNDIWDDSQRKINCPVCGKRVKLVGIYDHARDKHDGNLD